MRKLLLFTLLTVSAAVVFAQVSSTVNYTFTNTTSGSLTDMSTGTTSVLVPTSTSGEFSASASIGFDFWLMGTRYTNYSVNSNGLMRLGKSKVSTTSSNDMRAVNNLPFITAFWDDLNSYTISAGTRSRVHSKITGTAPNRVLTIEWKNFIIRSNSSNGVQLSTWQVRLYETTGVFQFVYGRMQIATGSSTVTASAGMSVTPGNTLNKLIYLTSFTTPAVSRNAGVAANTLVNSNTVGPIAGLNSSTNGNRTQYTFTSWLPNANPAALNFTAINPGGMTLNWTCAATNELGFVIYRSDDGGVTYHFVTQTAANATSSVQGGLSPNTTYFWKVYAVTEGALSAATTGNGTTTACIGAPLTNTLNYSGSSTGLIWSTAAWSLGHPPTACENAVINYTRSSSGSMFLTMDISASVNSLSINGIFSSSGNKYLKVITGANALTVLNDLSINGAGGTGTDSIGLYAGTGSVVNVNGNVVVGQASGTNLKKCVIGAASVTDEPDFYFKGNLTFNSTGRCFYPGSSGIIPGSYYFEGSGSKSITNNNNSSNIYFGNVDIGGSSPLTLTVTGSNSDAIYTHYGNLTVNSGATLVLPYDAYFNQNVAGFGDFILKSNATIRLGDNFGGQAGSNFPGDYESTVLDQASTVEYYGTSDQLIYDLPVYGNLTLTNNAVKYLNNFLEIEGNLLINPTATFGCDQPVYMYGPSVTNNGIIEGIFGSSEFSFYGEAAQTYSGTGVWQGASVGTPFAGLGVNFSNMAGITLNGPLATESAYLFNGEISNSNNMQIGSASWSFVQRGGSPSLDAGSFDTYPTIASTGNYTLYYFDAASNIVTGPEIPAGINTYRVYCDNANGVSLASDLGVNNDLQLLKDTFDFGPYTVKIANTISLTAGIADGDEGTLEMTGTSAQTIPNNAFQQNSLKNLVISNTNNVTGVTLADTLDVYRSVTFGTGGRKLTTGGFLSLKSTAAETAWLGQMTASNSIIGNVTVERYIPDHPKAWQFLATPASGQTVNAAWQEGNAPLSTAFNPGFGTIITSNYAGAGFDIVGGAGPSMMSYDSTAKTFIGIPNTTIPIYNRKGYMIFIRGNRTVTGIASAPTSANLRTRGTLFTPANPPSVINMAANTFESVGNPYASAIDLTALNLSGGVQDVFYVWDPKLTTAPSAYGFGAYQTFTRNGATYDVTPGGGSYSSGTCKTIESGQAFFIRAPLAAGSLSFTEACKVSGSNDVNRMPVNQVSQIRTNLYVQNGNERILLDGNRVQFDHTFSNRIDEFDAVKIGNTGENIGITRNSTQLAVDRRQPVMVADTIFFNTGKLRLKQYQLEIMPQKIAREGLEAYLEDNFLETVTELNLHDTNRISFNVVNSPGSYAADRFRIVFRINKKRNPVFPDRETVETAKQVDSNGKGIYGFESGDQELKTEIAVFPNPVEHKRVQVQFTGREKGRYMIRIISITGKLVYQGCLQPDSFSATAYVQLSKLTPAGIYKAVISSSSGDIKTISLFIK